mmetsp:Transcript_17813/g.50997  ORF Transcript_17813/g.50997 Transcript_17813/m.50997 type:complete len:228 (+) Transcript_17813:642-1325(+)
MEAPHTQHAQRIGIRTDQSERGAIKYGTPEEERSGEAIIRVQHCSLVSFSVKDGEKDHANDKSYHTNNQHRREQRMSFQNGIGFTPLPGRCNHHTPAKIGPELLVQGRLTQIDVGIDSAGRPNSNELLRIAGLQMLLIGFGQDIILLISSEIRHLHSDWITGYIGATIDRTGRRGIFRQDQRVGRCACRKGNDVVWILVFVDGHHRISPSIRIDKKGRDVFKSVINR